MEERIANRVTRAELRATRFPSERSINWTWPRLNLHGPAERKSPGRPLAKRSEAGDGRSCRSAVERRSTTSLRISTNSNERPLDPGNAIAARRYPGKVRGLARRGEEELRKTKVEPSYRGASSSRTTECLWSPAGSDADRKPGMAGSGPKRYDESSRPPEGNGE
ncbi:hypothetical protein KM043_012771 [Ampulex compressa]|nr:hypothetical protein KM043_012771 [Ampulex compressa]